MSRFTYLGSTISSDGDSTVDVQVRIGKAAGVFMHLNSVWKRNLVSIETKIKMYMSIVIPTAIYTYASETWQYTANISHRLNVFHQRWLRKIMRISWRDHVTNESVLRRAKVRLLSAIIAERRLRLAGHVLRMPNCHHACTALNWTPPDGRRRRGLPRIT